MIPVPVWDPEGGIINQFRQNSLIEVQVPPMPGVKVPAIVDLKLQFRVSGLFIGEIAISAVDISLLHEVAWIISRKSLHECNRFLVLGIVFFACKMRGRAKPHFVDRG